MEQAHILIVDDNPEIREIINILLTGEGFKTTEANNGAAALEPLFNLADDYTAVHIYDRDIGIYRAGRTAPIMDSGDTFRLFFDLGYRITDGEGEDYREFPLAFKNGTATVIMINYHRALFVYPYLIVCLLLSFLLFLCNILFFIGHKMKSVVKLEEAVLTMSSGDLSSPVPGCGGDEIGILARELNHLRESLNENILREQESRQANQDLITALSHDLRTPLTILSGYLEVIRLKRNPDLEQEYLERCLKKTKDMKELTDRMFEYALMSEENEIPEFTWIPTDFITQCLHENCDFIHLAGFEFNLQIPDATGVLKSDKTMLKRIFNNLFSNILKYGDKKIPVEITGTLKHRQLMLTISNGIKQELSHTASSNIGLRNVRKMLELLGNEMTVKQTNEIFQVKMALSLK